MCSLGGVLSSEIYDRVDNYHNFRTIEPFDSRIRNIRVSLMDHEVKNRDERIQQLDKMLLNKLSLPIVNAFELVVSDVNIFTLYRMA